MSFHPILGPSKLNSGTSDMDPASYPAATILSNGSFAVSSIRVGYVSDGYLVAGNFIEAGSRLYSARRQPLNFRTRAGERTWAQDL